MLVKVFTTRVEDGYVANVVRLQPDDSNLVFNLTGCSTTEVAASRYAARALAAEALGVTMYALKKARGQCVL